MDYSDTLDEIDDLRERIAELEAAQAQERALLEVFVHTLLGLGFIEDIEATLRTIGPDSIHDSAMLLTEFERLAGALQEAAHIVSERKDA